MVLVNPLKPLPTAEVFASRSGGFGDASPIERTPASVAALIEALSTRRNDLQAAACALEPSVVHVLDALSAQPGCGLARMSGSGATCFGLFENRSAAERAAQALARGQSDWWVVATSSQSG
jgi:4-diphosphocytidyl-2-C-methyl-D-erythritol kinase